MLLSVLAWLLSHVSDSKRAVASFLLQMNRITQLVHYFQAAHLARAAREHFVPLEISVFPELMPSSSTIKLMLHTLYTILHTPPVSKTANVKTWLIFIQSNIAILICVSFAVQYMLTLSFLLFNQASDNYFVKYLISKYLYSSLLGNYQCSNENKQKIGNCR